MRSRITARHTTPISLLVLLVAAGLLAFGVLGAQTIPAHYARLAPSVKPTATVVPTGPSGHLGPLINIPQTWNNCGPATVGEVLAYWGIIRNQVQVQAVLRADGDPLGMAPYGVPAYMRSLGVEAVLGVNGSQRLVKALISNGFPVIVDQYVGLDDPVGHYRPIQAYDDRRQVYVSSDPYLGQGHEIRYGDFDALWQSTNRQFIVIFPRTRQPLLNAVLAAAGWNITAASRQDLAFQQGLLKGTIVDHTLDGSPKSYYLAMAWDQLQLRQYNASRQSVQEALHLGASQIAADWITNELSLAMRP